MASTSREAPPSSSSETPTINNSTKTETKTKTKSKFSIRYLGANFKAKFRISRPKPVENNHHNLNASRPKPVENNHHNLNAASSSATTNKDDHHGEALSSFADMIPSDLHLVDLALKRYTNHMTLQINQAREKFKELQNLGRSETDLEELRIAIDKLKLQIPPTSNEEYDDHDGDISISIKMIRNDLNLGDKAFAKAEKYMNQMNMQINQAHMRFEELLTSGSSKRDIDELRKAVVKLKYQIPSHLKIHSADSNSHRNRWPNINGAEDGMTHFFHQEPEFAHIGNFYDRILDNFLALSEPLRYCLLFFFKFPPAATIKRTTMIYLWIGHELITSWRSLSREEYTPNVNEELPREEDDGNKIFDEFIEKGFIEPIYQNCSLVPDSCSMSLSVRSSIYEEAQVRGFTSNGDRDLDPRSVRNSLFGHSCLINVGEAIINWEPEIIENMKHIKSLYLGKWQSLASHHNELGKWQSLASHHIELADSKILRGLKKLNSLTFLSLRGISMITELPISILRLKKLSILDLRACHNLEVIPDNISLLNNLTHLDISECYFLEHMPESLAQLYNLQVLKGFVIGDFNDNKQSCTLRDLSRLSKLIKLNIYVSAKDFLRLRDSEYLEKFEGLQKLTISWGGCSFQAQAQVITEAFQCVVATLPPKLHKLDLQCFPTTSIPDWLMPGKLKELKKLYIRGGQLCDLGQSRKHQGEQWNVEILHLKYLRELQIDWKELMMLFPKLIYLHQVECPKFTNFPYDYEERCVWMNKEANDTHMQLKKYLRASGRISSSSMSGSGPTLVQDNCSICPVDEKQL